MEVVNVFDLGLTSYLDIAEISYCCVPGHRSCYKCFIAYVACLQSEFKSILP